MSKKIGGKEIQSNSIEFRVGKMDKEMDEEIDKEVDQDMDNKVDDNTHPAISLRKTAARILKRQADWMVQGGLGILSKVTVGDNILVPIPSFDRGQGNPSNLLAVILTI